jgi:hypothetical protein
MKAIDIKKKKDTVLISLQRFKVEVREGDLYIDQDGPTAMKRRCIIDRTARQS